ncbi:Synaptic vesicle transporter SV2 (major facilitator superfamily) [Plasmopara halstedii]|uniref:Synaptic vesicle transporter SV2 (Major facilitator superfamily) n=1 Tax=Plasmopara halstedii TaxID=4781 RepID=A0A0P1B6G2_PLAHL|nr:Synaptic vesicle transporter SV2 (major facilitator superfamily) [Plasmopara halstedii]CEG49998.1 Synaptic vesicle transporter SV2 (major facilitator superfamily) [Plasmopara halstedii]|eukprot:XP_024586367.1 Synaptic vesicle transporter SV2 (major facilitator superfamily) [Plasmopara halstedii]
MRFQGIKSTVARPKALTVSLENPVHLIDEQINSFGPHLSKFYIRLLLLIGVSWAIQAAELVLLIFTRVLVTQEIKMGTQVHEICGVGILIGSTAGGPIFGHVADKFGRRAALIIAMIFSLAGLAISSCVNVEYMLILGLVIIGFGYGGQLASTFILIHELTPRSMSCRIVALLNAFTGFGGLLGVVLTYAVAPQLGWRTTYLLTSGLVLYAFVLYFMVLESPRWLASVGRTKEAFNIVKDIEQSGSRMLIGNDAQKAALHSISVQNLSATMMKSSQPQQPTPTLVLWILWITMTVSSYTLGVYFPTLISLNGYNIFTSWTTTSALKIAQVVGSVTAATVLDAYGSHRCFVVFASLAATLSIVLSYMAWWPAVVIFFLFIVTALLSAGWSCVLAYTPIHYELTHRGSKMGYAIGVSHLAAVGGRYLYPYMFNIWTLSVSMLCWISGGLLVIVAITIGVAPKFGYRPLAQEDDDSLCTLSLNSDLENMSTPNIEILDEKSVMTM